MTAKKPPPFVPKLRFPEFRDAPDWEEVLLGTLLVRAPDYGVNAAAVPFSETLPTYIRITDINDDGQFAPGPPVSVDIDATDAKYLQDGDIVLARTGASVGKSYRYREEDGRLVYAGFLIRVTPNPERLLSRFLAAYLSTASYRDWVRLTSARSGQPGINATEYASIPLPLPPDTRTLGEQKKIADCLGSLDDLIAAEARKLEALRQHKQGLVQQLFPRPGETVPRLRFPEFRGDTTWLAPQLGKLYGFKRTNTLSRANLNYEFGTIRNIHYGDIHTKFAPLFRMENEHVPYINLDVAPNGFDDEAFCEEGDIVLADASEDLDGVGTAIEVVSLNGERVVAGTHTILATRRGSVPVVGFGGLLFQSAAVRTAIKREAQGAKVYGISATRISAIPIPIPPTEAEQQRIATCLASLEDVLAARVRMIDTLKQRKQGLLQQLYPSLET